DTSRIILQGGIGSPIYLSVTSNAWLEEKGEVSLFDVKSDYSFQIGQRNIAVLDSFHPIPIVLTVSNTGNRIIQPSGQIIVRQNYTSRTETVTLPKQYVLTGSQRILKGSPGDESVDQQTGTTVILPGQFMGVFKAEAFVNIAKSTTQQKKEIYFLIFPFTYM